MTAACADDPRPPEVPRTSAPASRAVADPADHVTTELDGVATAYGEGALAQATGDETAARAAYERVLSAPDQSPHEAARAALHLAQLEARAGKTRRTLELAAKAGTLAPADVAIAEGVAQLQADVVAASGTGDIRGPRLGTTLPVEAKVASAFAAAEKALAQVHALHPRPYIEALSSSIALQEDATEDVVAKYRAVGEHGGLAQVASDYRIGSLYHDLALSLLFEPPSELDPAAAAALRRTLRAHAQAYLKRAVASYRACLGGPKSSDAELWQLSAETDLRAAQDVLGESK